MIADDPRHPTLFDKRTGEIRTSKLRKSEVETYYGFGEKAFSGMSREGQYIVNWNTDTFAYQIGTDPIYQSIPFFYALYNGKTYGLFFNNTFRTWFDMGKTSPERYSFGADGGELDYFVFHRWQRAKSEKGIARLFKSDGNDAPAADLGFGLSAVAMVVFPRKPRPRDRCGLSLTKDTGGRYLSRHRLYGWLPGLYMGQTAVPRPGENGSRSQK